MIQKLKQENEALKDALEQARAADVAMLKTRLRAVQADLLHYKQLNTELKERIQTLEEKFFKALSDQYERGDDSTVATKSISQTLKERLKQKQLASQLGFPHHEQQQYAGDILSQSSYFAEEEPPESLPKTGGIYQGVKLTDGVKASYLALQNRCRHLESLNASYEKTVKLMQDELSASRELNSISLPATIPVKMVSFTEFDDTVSTSTSVSIQHEHIDKTNEDSFESTNLQKLKSNKKVRKLIEEARLIDQKTIQELTKELNRLSKLLPKHLLDEDQDNNVEIKQERLDSRNTEQDVVNPTTIAHEFKALINVGKDNSEGMNGDSNKTYKIESPTNKEIITTKDGQDWFQKCWGMSKVVATGLIVLFALFVVVIELVPSFLMSD